MLLLHLSDVDEASWAEALRAALGDYPVVRRGEDYDPADVRYIFVWKPRPEAFDGLTGLRAILSRGAGVDALLKHPALPDAPIVRFVDEDLSQRMSDYVVAHVTMHHRLYTRFQADQKAKRWSQLYPPAASETTVGIMGMGVLGQDAASRLKPLGFDLRSWSRTPKDMTGVEGFAGAEQFAAFLAGTDILVNLLPLTPETTGILNTQTFAKLRRDRLAGGPVIVNAARGGHQRESDIVAALRDGTLGAASLDVFETEPLPASSPLWDIENCYITPHIAAISNEATGVRYFTNIIKRHEAGEALVNVVDRRRGY
ncbi:glyoxylate/hydroxypyruvate reductase A [Devosia neptuniae]|jgi:glyoxylate/hydroxypyruvate reductase A|uniref:2-hydroxyacid dehydrogenase n=1 Tax=Devosia TaxID=46913 RepID=UPI0022AEAB24|nr:glyoxylate/hydroxypyruvate reductase A [Devosia neptuniae]MCZ4346936.1 glyoxylate/hydroxypyruvate reductase A [Devosia neptuniae]|tara:strand:+ start:19501 stop:20439 length:939 start_codon:yes stop_codon:yes gene_type:complete